VDEDDIDAVLKTAAHTHIPHNRHRPLNALSSLPSSKAKLRIAIKERIRHLAGAYISLATFIDDDDMAFMERNPKSKRTKAIYMRVLKDIEKAEKEIKNFKIG
jgi:hypothetical protein